MKLTQLRRHASLVIFITIAMYGLAQNQPPAAANGVPSPRPASRAVGSVQSLTGNNIVLRTDSGSDLTVSVPETARIIRIEPGQTNLKDAPAMTLQELQVGDRVFVKGTTSSDEKSIVASSAIVMKKSDVTARQDEQRQEWRKQGVGGLVKAVLPASGAIDISVTNFAATMSITVHTTKSTVIRRYAPDSVKFDDSKPGTLDQIKPGDQLRAKGKRSEDGTELEAEEIVSGTFRNIAGNVSSVDAGQNAIVVSDLISKKTVTVKIGRDSQVRQLPAMMAQRIAMRLKAGQGDHVAAGGAAAGGQPGPGPSGGIAPPEGDRGNVGGYPGGGRPGGAPDLQQMLSRLPQAKFADIHKGDAVLIVTTEGSANSIPTAITMLTGVEQILTSSPDSSRASSLLSAWNLGSSGGDAAAAQ